MQHLWKKIIPYDTEIQSNEEKNNLKCHIFWTSGKQILLNSDEQWAAWPEILRKIEVNGVVKILRVQPLAIHVRKKKRKAR